MVKDEKARFTFRVPQKLMDALKERADELGVSMNALTLNILWDWARKCREEEK